MVGNAYTILNSLHMTKTNITSIRMETTVGIRDGTKRTGDLLSQAIGILGLEAKTSLNNIREGDGATVLPFASINRGYAAMLGKGCRIQSSVRKGPV